MLSKTTLETIVSFSEFWGVLITLLGAALLFVTVVANGPLKRLLATEAENQRQQNERQQLVLQAQIADAQQAAALANERAEHERLARMQIEQRLAPRRIGEKESRAFLAALTPYAGTSVQLVKLGDLEASQFADDLIKILSGAKWNVQISAIGTMSPPVYGIQCAADDSTAGKALAAVIKKLPGADVAVLRSNPDVHGRILVGLKPPP